MPNVFTLFILVFLLVGCAKSITTYRFPSKEIIPSGNRTQLTISSKKSDSLQILYLGCGHLIMQYGKDCIATDPFFSTQGLTKRKISTSTDAFKKYNDVVHEHAIDLTQISSVWLAHTHYDHMMDLPILLEKRLITENARVYGSDFGDSILSNFIKDDQYHSILLHEAFDPGNPKAIPQWLNAAPTIRVMPIRSNHAPHIKIGPAKISFMKGRLPSGYFKTTLKQSTSVTKRKNWKEGTTYAYLVDFMQGEQIQLRVFLQTSASDFPKGSPPDEILNDHKVDIAILCAASANYVKPYPIDILKQLQPQKVIFIHWEDFFRASLDFDSVKLLRATNFRKLDKRLGKAGFPLIKEKYVMPRPGTMITIKTNP